MPRLLALEWDTREARLAVGRVEGARLVLEHAFAVSMEESSPGGAPADVAARISAALAARGITPAETLVAVGRTSIELRLLELPPAPDEELPDLVRFQALKSFHQLSDDWRLDYLPLASDAGEPRQVLAAAIAPDLLAQIESTCRDAGLAPRRIALRPCGAASLLVRSGTGSGERVRMLVDPLADEADLTVLDGDDVILTRTVRLASGDDAAETWTGLVGEIRRTRAAAQNQLAGTPVEAVYLCGDEEELGPLAAIIERQLELPARLFDPLADVAHDRRFEPPRHPGRYAPLVGLLRDEAADVAAAIDFRNPRRPPAPPSRRRVWSLAAAAAAAAVLLAVVWLWRDVAALDDQIERLRARSTALAALEKETDELAAENALIAGWTDGDVVWLDELARLSEQFPPAEEALLTALRMSSRSEGGRLELEGHVRSAGDLQPLETRLRDTAHRVTGHASQQQEDGGRYEWQFNAAVDVAPRDTETDDPPPTEAAADASVAAGETAVADGAGEAP